MKKGHAQFAEGCDEERSCIICRAKPSATIIHLCQLPYFLMIPNSECHQDHVVLIKVKYKCAVHNISHKG